VFQQNVGQWIGTGKRYVGSAVVTSTQNLVVIVNQSGPTTASSYEGFGSAGTANINLPLIMANNASFYTAIQILNASSTPCGSVTVDYSPSISGPYVPTDESFGLPGNASLTIFQSGSSPSNNSINSWGTSNPANKYFGSAIVSAPGCQLMAIVNQTRASSSVDNYMTYIGYNY
jgi:hypothetical protein